MIKFFCALCFFVFVFQEISSQKILDFDSYTIEDGFSSSKPNVILQDSKGFIWVGTWNGLTRFDGYECVVYKSGIENEKNTISNREVVSLIEDRNGHIWIGTSCGLNRLKPETGEIIQYPFESRIMMLYEDSDGMIWVGTWSDGLYRLDPKSEEIELFFSDDVISDVQEDRNNEFWVATYDGLVNLNRLTKTFVKYLPNSKISNRSVNHSVLTQLELSANGDLWIASWGGGISRMTPHLDKDSLRFDHFKVRAGEGSMLSNEIYRLHYDQFNNLWIGTWDKGLALLDSAEQQKTPSKAYFHTFVADSSDPYTVSGNNITALYVDRTGILWVGSSKIDRASVLNVGIKRYSSISDNSRGLTQENPVRSFAGDQKGNLWVGTANNLLHYIEKKDGYHLMKTISNQRYLFNGSYFQSTSILSLLCIPGGLLVGTDDAGLLYYRDFDLEKNANPTFSFYNTETNNALPGNKINKMVWSQKHSKTIWMGTMQSGFVRATLDGDSFSFKSYQSSDSGLSDDNIRDVVEDRDGIIWIATQRGLNRFDPETEIFTTYLFSKVNNKTINDNVINCLHEDKMGNIWIGTNTGLNKKEETVHASDNLLVTFKRYTGFPYVGNELIMNIVEGNSTHLFIGFYGGLVKFDYEQESVIDEYMMREYQRIGMERNASFKDHEGKMFMGGTHGFISFSSDDLNHLSQPPIVAFTDLLIANNSVQNASINDENLKGSIEKTVPYLDRVTFSHKDRILTFVFSAMDFKNPKKNTFTYILEGFDDDWNHVGDRNAATYTNIPHGKYILKVNAINSDGVESSSPTIMQLVILPPWWLTNWAYVLYLLILLGLLYFFKRYSLIRQKEKGHLMLERMAHEKEEELYEMKVRFFTNITHEFRTPLSLILGPAEESLSRSDLPTPVYKSLELIQRNTKRLLRLVNQLIEFRKVEKDKMELFLQKINVVSILIEMEESFRPIAQANKIDFQLHYAPSDISAWIDRDKFEKILFNLLSNAFKFVEQEGKIVLRAGIEKHLDYDLPVLFIEVTDSGIGIHKEEFGLIFDRFYQVNEKLTQSTGGIGLFLCKSFVEQHKGKIEVESEPGQGSTFKVIIPMDLGRQMNREVESLTKERIEESYDHLIEEDQNIVTLETGLSGQENVSKPCILLVEDDAELLGFISEGLSNLFEVHVATNGHDGFEMAKRIEPELIISDIMMPILDGYEMGKLMRNDIETSHIPLVFLTAKTMREDEIQGLRIGAVDYIYKPFNLETLRLKVLNILKARIHVKEKYRTEKLLEPEKITLSSLDEEFLRNAVSVVDRLMDDPNLDVEKLSEQLSLSSNQTYRKIKALTGYTAKEFIRVQRLKISAQLLAQRKRTISEIIYMVGFSSPSYFSRCFKEQYGCTPTEFMEKQDDDNDLN